MPVYKVCSMWYNTYLSAIKQNMTTAQTKRQRREYRKFAQEIKSMLPERAVVWFRRARNG